MNNFIKTDPKMMTVFVSPSATLRRTLEEYFETNLVGNYKIVSSITNKRLLNTRVDFLILDLSYAFLLNVDELNAALHILGADVTVFYEKGIENYIEKIDAAKLKYISFHQKPEKEAFNFIQNILFEYNLKSEKFSEISQLKNEIDFSIRPNLVAIGASTGGPDALVFLVESFPKNFPPVLIVLHMADRFIPGFCDRLQSLTSLSVVAFQKNQKIKKNTIIVASGNQHMMVRMQNDVLFVVKGGSEKVNSHCPSIDILFGSISELKECYSVGVLLTGMGSDGALGLLKMRNNQSMTIAQDESSSAIYGMPKVANDLNAATIVADLNKISEVLEHFESTN